MPRPWSDIEVSYLIKHAGRDTVTDIASVLSRSRHDVRREASIRGLNVACPRSALVICPSCGRGRTRLYESGICPVCATREATAMTRMRISMELAVTPPEIRRDFGRFVGQRGPIKPPPRRPRQPSTLGMRPEQKVRAMDVYLAAVEQWELVLARREYDAERQRLHRLRVAIGERRRG